MRDGLTCTTYTSLYRDSRAFHATLFFLRITIALAIMRQYSSPFPVAPTSTHPHGLAKMRGRKESSTQDLGVHFGGSVQEEVNVGSQLIDRTVLTYHFAVSITKREHY